MNTVHYNIWFDLIVDMYGYRDNRLVSTALVDSLNFCKTRQSRNIWRSRLYALISDYSSVKVNNTITDGGVAPQYTFARPT